MHTQFLRNLLDIFHHSGFRCGVYPDYSLEALAFILPTIMTCKLRLATSTKPKQNNNLLVRLFLRILMVGLDLGERLKAGHKMRNLI